MSIFRNNAGYVKRRIPHISLLLFSTLLYHFLLLPVHCAGFCSHSPIHVFFMRLRRCHLSITAKSWVVLFSIRPNHTFSCGNATLRSSLIVRPLGSNYIDIIRMTPNLWLSFRYGVYVQCSVYDVVHHRTKRSLCSRIFRKTKMSPGKAKGIQTLVTQCGRT